LLVGIMLNDPTSYNIQGVLTGSTLDQVTQKPTNDPQATLGEIFFGNSFLVFAKSTTTAAHHTRMDYRFSGG